MAIAYRTNGVSSQTLASGTTTISLSKPTGVVENDIMLAVLNLELYDPATVPDGWALVTSVNHGSTSLRERVYWKRAGASESGPYAWTCTSQWGGGSISTYSGVTTSGNPWEGTPSTNSGGSGTTATFNSTTTSSADAMLVALGVTYNTGTRWSSWAAPITNERVDVDAQAISDGIQASPGASGTKTATLSASDYWCAIMVALAPAGSDLSASGLSNETLKLSESSVSTERIDYTTLTAGPANETLDLADVATLATVDPLEASAQETLTLSESAEGAITLEASATETLTLTEEAVQATREEPEALNATPADETLTLAEGPPDARVYEWLETILIADQAPQATITEITDLGANGLGDETLALSDSVTATLDPLEAAPSETLALSESASAARESLETLTASTEETLRLSDTVAVQVDLLEATAQEALALSDATALTLDPLEAVTSEALVLSDTATGALGDHFLSVADETLRLSDSAAGQLDPLEVSGSETLRLSESSVSAVRSEPGELTVSLTETLTLSDSGFVSLESPLRITDQAPQAELVGETPGVSLSETFVLSDSVEVLISDLYIALGETFRLSEAGTVERGLVSPLRISDEAPVAALAEVADLSVTGLSAETLSLADEAPAALLDPLSSGVLSETLAISDDTVSAARIDEGGLAASLTETLVLSEELSAGVTPLWATPDELLRLSDQAGVALDVLEAAPGAETLRLSDAVITSADLLAAVDAETLALSDSLEATFPVLPVAVADETLALGEESAVGELDVLEASPTETLRLSTSLFVARTEGDELAVGLTETLALSEALSAEKPDLNLELAESLALSDALSALRLPLEAVLATEVLALSDDLRTDQSGFTLRFCPEPDVRDAAPTASCTMESLAAESSPVAEVTEAAGTAPTACLTGEE